MPTFDYRGAKQAGYTDAEIMQHLESEHAAGRDWSISPGDTAQASAPAPQPSGMEAIRNIPLMPLMPGSPRVRDASAALPFAGAAVGSAMGGPVGAGIGTGIGELGRQSLLGESPDLGRASIEAFLGGILGPASKIAARGGKAALAGAGQLARDIPVLRRGGRALSAAKNAAKPPAPRHPPVAAPRHPPVAPPKVPPPAPQPSNVIPINKPPPKPKAPAKPKPAAKAAPAEERVPIKVIGDKGKVQNATRGKSQRGATQRQLAARKPRAAPEPLDAASRLELSLEFEKEMARRGFSQQQRQALRRGAMEYLQQGGAQ